MTLKQGMFCGGVAGLINCVIITPVELVKCRLQVQFENKSKSYYKGVIDCLGKVYRADGIKGIYTGNFITILREIPAYAGQFGAYHLMKMGLCKLKHKKFSELSNLEIVFCGTVGGYSAWQFAYPQV